MGTLRDAAFETGWQRRPRYVAPFVEPPRETVGLETVTAGDATIPALGLSTRLSNLGPAVMRLRPFCGAAVLPIGE